MGHSLHLDLCFRSSSFLFFIFVLVAGIKRCCGYKKEVKFGISCGLSSTNLEATGRSAN